MIEYKPIQITDKKVIDSYLLSVSYRNCDFSFANLFCWQQQYQTSFAIVNDFLIIRYICDDGFPCYMMPVGKGNIVDIIQIMMEDARHRENRFRIHAITLEMFKMLDEKLHDTFVFALYRDYYEYIYASEDLINLKGKKYQPKRNHINRFINYYPTYRYAPITKDIIYGCKNLYNQWKQEYNAKHEEPVMQGEEQAVFSGLDNFEELDLKGGAIIVENKVIAFSIGQAVTEDTFVVYIEKALSSYHGAFQLINQQFIAHEAKAYPYINREEDLGIPSLRQAKMSYYPVRFLERGSVCLKENVCP